MQILRIGAVIHVLFHYDKPHDVPWIISCDAIKSSVKFVDTCIQHVLFVLGSKDIKDEIDEIQQKLQSDVNSTDTLLSTRKTYTGHKMPIIWKYSSRSFHSRGKECYYYFQ